MNKFIEKIKISGIINIIFASFIVLTSEELSFYSVTLLTTGIIFLVLSTKTYEELIAKERSLVILAIINLPFNVISSFLILLAIDNIKTQNIERNNSPPITKEKPQIDPETKKIDLLLKLGVVMVFSSGLIFATTSWSVIPDITKAIVLFLIGLLFIGLSKFVDIKLKITKTSNTYWLLGMFFFLFFLISLMYFKIISPNLSFTGPSRYICNFITLIATALIAFLSSKKFQTKGILYITYLILYLALYNFLQYFNLTSNLISSILLSLVLIGNILLHNKKENYLYKTNKLINYFAWLLVLINYFNDYDYFSSFLATLLTITNLYFVLFKEKDNIYNNFIPIISAAMLMIITNKTSTITWKLLPSMIIITGLYLLIALTNKHSNSIKTVNQITYNIFGIIAIFYLNDSSIINIEPLITSIIFLIINVISNIKLKDKISMYMQPIIILLTISTLLNYLGNFVDKISIYHQIILLTLTYTLLHTIARKEENKKLYYICTLISAIFLHIIPFTINDLSIPAIILIPLAYLYLYLKTSKEKKALLLMTYSLFILSIYDFFVVFNIIQLHPIFAAITTIWLYVIFLYFKENKTEKNIILIALILPMLSIINNITIQTDLKTIIGNLLIFYIIYLIIKIFVKDAKAKNTITTIGFIFTMLTIIFKTSTLIGIYVGVISLLAIILGYYKNEYKNLFKLGVITTIFNIIYQLRAFWGKIPFYLYLLITGLGLIAFVTYKEIIKNDNDKNH